MQPGFLSSCALLLGPVLNLVPCIWLGLFDTGTDGTDQSVQHFRYFLAFVYPGIPDFIFDIADSHPNVNLGSQFACRALCIIQKIRQFLVRVSFMSFGDVRRYRKSSSRDLIPKAKVFQVSHCLIQICAQSSRSFPHIEIFKSCHTNSGSRCKVQDASRSRSNRGALHLVSCIF